MHQSGYQLCKLHICVPQIVSHHPERNPEGCQENLAQCNHSRGHLLKSESWSVVIGNIIKDGVGKQFSALFMRLSLGGDNGFDKIVEFTEVFQIDSCLDTHAERRSKEW